MPQLLGGLSQFLTWIYYAAFALIVGYLLWRNRAKLAAYLRHLREQWLALLAWLSGRRAAEAEATEAVATPVARRVTFRDFKNPFLPPGPGDRDVGELVRYTFAALEAWADDHGCGRAAEQTPLEFVRDVARAEPEFGRSVREVGDLYCRLAYGDRRLPRQTATILSELWTALQSAAARSNELARS